MSVTIGDLLDSIDLELLQKVRAQGGDINAALKLWDELENPEEMVEDTEYAR